MAGETVRSVFFTPPMAVARLGGSDTPVDAYVWREDPSLEGGGLTSLEPAVSLAVTADGSVRSYRPTELVFRDESGLRPVAPFLELCVELDDGSVSRLTSALLTELGGTLADVSYVVEAANRKAQRRTGDPACAFSARVQFDHTEPTDRPLLASSEGSRILVSPDRPIPLGSIRPVRPVPGPPDERDVDRDVLRLRFTPAKGRVYGPPSAATGRFGPMTFEIVPDRDRILNEETSWRNYEGRAPDLRHPRPHDTYDGSGDPSSSGGRSWGVVDDTCDVLVTATVTLAGQDHVAHARVFVGPPDFAPDKRPFFSLVDDLLDRDEPDPEFDPAVTRLEVADLLRRVLESVSLNNVDLQRRRAVVDNERELETLLDAADSLGISERIQARLGRGGVTPEPPLANEATMTDADEGYRASERNQLRADAPRPYAELARDAHSALTAYPTLMAFLARDADRVRRLLRQPYALVRESTPAEALPVAGRRRPWDPEAWLHDMRMPPYMRDSDASPLSLTRRQYVQVMSLLDELAPVAPAPRPRRRRERGLAPDEAPALSADELFARFRSTDVTTAVPEPRR